MVAIAPIELWPATPADPFSNLLAPANETSTDAKYLRHQFVTWQGWQDWHKGWTPPEAREAVEAHLKGWLYNAASLARHTKRLAYVQGALTVRTAPPLRTQWRQDIRRGPKWVAADLHDIWTRQWAPSFEERLIDMALLGGSLLHVHWIPDVRAGIERPVLRRWPHEAIWWRPASPAFPGGWYAITADSGLVRIVPGDGKWIVLAHGERWHENAAILSLGELFVHGKLAERDEAGLSEAAGRAAPIGTLPDGVKINDPDPNETAGKDFQTMIAGLGRARVGAVVPFGAKVEPFSIESETAFFDRYNARLAAKIGLAINGRAGMLTADAKGVYTPIVAWSVDEALTEKDHTATERGWNWGLARPFCDINAVDADVGLVGEKYADANDKAKRVAERATLHANTIAAMRSAGLDPSQEDADVLADALSTAKIKLGPKAAPPPGGGFGKGPADLAQKDVAAVERPDEKAGA